MVKFFFRNIYLMKFGEWLKQKRKEAGISQRFVAENAILPDGTTVTDAYISSIERGYDTDKYDEPTLPDKYLVVAIAKVLKASIDEALLVAGYAPKNVPELHLEIAKLNLVFFSEQQISEIIGFILFKAQTQTPVELQTKEEIESTYGLKPGEIKRFRDKKTIQLEDITEPEKQNKSVKKRKTG